MADSLSLLIKSAFDASGVTAATNSINKIDSQINKVSRGMTKFMGLMGAGGVGAAIYSFAASSVKAYAESEKGVVRLTQAMKNLGSFSQAALQDQLDYAAALQKTTRYSDEQVVEVQTALTTYGLYGEKLKAATLATLDLATQTGDSASAAKIVGKAYQGQTDTLGKMGIKISDTLVGMQKFDAVMAQLQARFGGMAVAEGASLSGTMDVLANRVDNLKERVGEWLLPVLKEWAHWADVILKRFEKIGEGPGSVSGSNYVSAVPNLQKQLDALREKDRTEWRPFTYSGQRPSNPKLEAEIARLEKAVENAKKYEAAKTAPDTRMPVPPAASRKPAEAELDNQTASWMLNERNQLMLAYYRRHGINQKKFNRDSNLTEQERARENKKILQDIEAEWQAGSRTISGGFEQAFMEMGASAANWRDNWIGIVNGAMGPAKAAVHDFFTSTSGQFLDLGELAKGVFDGIKKAFLNMLEEMAAKAAVYGFLNLMSGGSLGATTSLGKFLGFANGGIMTSRGAVPLNAYAAGGVANSPQMAVFGEGRQPEAFVPLPDGRAIPVKMQGGAGTSITQNFNINGTGGNVDEMCRKIADAARRGVASAVDLSKVAYKVGAKRSGETAL